MFTRRHFVSTALASAAVAGVSGSAIAAESTPIPLGCPVDPPASTPSAGANTCSTGLTTSSEAYCGHDMSDMEGVEYDQMYIDAMIPHHASIIALAEAALPELINDELKTIAQAILDTQPGEIDTLKSFREEWYGSADPEPMSKELMMGSMGPDMHCDEHMDHMGGMDDMMNMMDSEWQVNTFNDAFDKDKAFVEQTIPHHEMAVDMSNAALKHATHQELKDLAQDVIDAQTAEIEQLKTIQEQLG